MAANNKEDAAKGDVEEQVDSEEAAGFHGDEVDPTPNENYSFHGAAAGKPTPETDPAHAHKVRTELQEKAHG